MNTIDLNNLESLSGPQLVALFNSVPGVKPISKFSSRQSGINRIRSILGSVSTDFNKVAEETGLADAADFVQKNERPAVSAPVQEDGLPKRRRELNLQPKDGAPRQVRATSKRALALSLLLRENGASFQEIMEATGWDYRNAYDGVKLIHTAVGYGLIEEGGRIRAFLNS